MKFAFRKFYLLLAVVLLIASRASAQDDPNPDSPVPVLLTGPDSSRVLAVNTRGWDGSLPMTGQNAFRPSANTTIAIFVSNLQLMSGEGIGAVRVYVEQRSGKTFEMQTERIYPVTKSIYAIELRLYDRDGYRGQPIADGDSLIYLTWRG